MRTKTNITMGNGLEDFAKAIKAIYPAGGMAIVYQDKEKAQKLATMLGEADYRFYLYSLSDCQTKPLRDYVRFVVGMCEEVSAVSKLAGNKTYVFFADNINYQYFMPSEMSNFAEFVYFDNTLININNAKNVIEAYICAFSVMTELLLIAYYESAMPFVDKGMHGIIKALKQLLLCGCDKDKYMGEMLRLIKMSIEYINERGIKCYYVQNAQNLYKNGTSNKFLVTYFINMMLLLFTKWNFNDILVPAENLIIDVALLDSFGLDSTLLLTREELHIISHKVRGQIALPSIDYPKMFSAIQYSVNKDAPLFAGINNRGIIKGISEYD